MKRTIIGIVTVLILGISITGFTWPTPSFGQPTISITGAYWNDTYGLTVMGDATFSNAGTLVSSITVLDNGPQRAIGMNNFGDLPSTFYGTYDDWSTYGDGNDTPGKYVLTAEIIGTGGTVLVTSRPYTITIP